MIINMKHTYLALLWIIIFQCARATYPPYGGSKRNDPSFLPSGKGKTPSCVRDPRLTYCITPKKYPKDRILYLLKNKMFDVDTLLQDETRDTYTFESRDGMIIPAAMTYGPVQPKRIYPQPGKEYMRSKVSASEQNSSYSYGHWTSKPPSVNSFTSGYPTKNDNNYKSGHSNQGRTMMTSDDGSYSRSQRNGHTRTTASYSSSPAHRYWWKKSSGRQKRQANLEDLCPSQANYIMPRAAQSVEGGWMFLVNVGDQYRQLVKSEICIRNTCEGSCDTPDGFSAICQQQYVQKRLVALDGSGVKLNSDTFWFPSCCICKVRPVGG